MSYMRVLAALAVLAMGATAAKASDLESLHAFNANLDLKPGWTLQLHSRLRTFKEASQFQQFRFGPILIWQAKPRVGILLGQYFLVQQPRAGGPEQHVRRTWGGAQFRVMTKPKYWVDFRSLVEFHSSASFEDYMRTRQRGMITFKVGSTMPYASTEVLLQQDVWYWRYTAGLQFRPAKKALLSLGWEYRDAMSGPGSHIIATMLQFDGIRFVPDHID